MTATDMVSGGNVTAPPKRQPATKSLHMDFMQGKGKGARELHKLLTTAAESGMKTTGIYKYKRGLFTTSLYMLNYDFMGSTALIKAVEKAWNEITREFYNDFK